MTLAIILLKVMVFFNIHVVRHHLAIMVPISMLVLRQVSNVFVTLVQGICSPEPSALNRCL